MSKLLHNIDWVYANPRSEGIMAPTRPNSTFSKEEIKVIIIEYGALRSIAKVMRAFQKQYEVCSAGSQLADF